VYIGVHTGAPSYNDVILGGISFVAQYGVVQIAASQRTARSEQHPSVKTRNIRPFHDVGTELDCVFVPTFSRQLVS